MGGGMDNLFSTHPNPENRVAALSRIAQEMGQGTRPQSINEAAARGRVSALDPLKRRR